MRCCQGVLAVGVGVESKGCVEPEAVSLGGGGGGTVMGRPRQTLTLSSDGLRGCEKG